MDFDTSLIVLLAFSAGLLHALDADHVMAVSAIAAKKLGMKAIIRLCINWSLGHGLVLFVVGSSILLLGLAIPVELSEYAEKLVAVLLIGIGAWVLKDLYQARAHIHFHSHDGSIRHAHWHRHDRKAAGKEIVNRKIDLNFLAENKIKFKKVNANQHDHNDHSAVMIGIVHGMAGLAPLLAIIPISNQPLWLGVAYLLVFCIGVFLAMLIFGGVLEKVLRYIQNYGTASINVLRSLVGMGSIVLGVAWLN
jgi:cytochrome c biogenesis protein CcdA